MLDAASPLILASTSRYRTELLSRLRLPFEAIGADVDERAAAGETPQALADRLALAKAQTVAQRFPSRWVLGSDQVCAIGDVALGKPGTRENACAQLALQSGKTVEFFTAVALVAEGHVHRHTDSTRVRFRALGEAEIARYVEAESPLDCAGSFKCEGYGITLFEAVESVDPTALVGLPLIAVRRLLAAAGKLVP